MRFIMPLYRYGGSKVCTFPSALQKYLEEKNNKKLVAVHIINIDSMWELEPIFEEE